MKRPMMPYPCVGYCMIDSRGYCVACGRPPTLGMPEACVVKPAAVQKQPSQEDSVPLEEPAAKQRK